MKTYKKQHVIDDGQEVDDINNDDLDEDDINDLLNQIENIHPADAEMNDNVDNNNNVDDEDIDD